MKKGKLFHYRTSGLLALCMVAGTIFSGVSAEAKEGDIVLKMNGTAVPLIQPPIKIKDDFFIPLRGVFESLRNGKVEWNEATQTATAHLKDSSVDIHVSVTIGSRQAMINNKQVELEQPVFLQNGVTMVPAQVLNKKLGNRIEWDEKSSTLYMIRNGLGSRLVDRSVAGKVTMQTMPESMVSKDGTVQEAAVAADRYLRDVHFNGTALIARKGEVLLERGYGEEQIGSVNSPRTKFRLMSVTKAFTAAAILQLEEKGLLNTDDTIAKYIQGVPNGERITLHHLLSHTSGLPREYPRVRNASMEQTIEAIRQSEPVSEPGIKHSYSNAGYVLLAAVIENVSGIPYGEYIKSQLFLPLGMKDSDQSRSDESGEYRAVGYWRDGAILKREPYHVSQSGAGDLVSTVRDLYTWDRALYTNQVLQQSSIQKMFTPNVHEYGYGWYTKEPNVVYHTGSGSGFSTMIYRKVDEELVIILLSNVSETDVKTMTKKLLTLLPKSW